MDRKIYADREGRTAVERIAQRIDHPAEHRLAARDLEATVESVHPCAGSEVLDLLQRHENGGTVAKPDRLGDQRLVPSGDLEIA